MFTTIQAKDVSSFSGQHFWFCEIKFLSSVVAICDLLRDMEIKHVHC